MFKYDVNMMNGNWYQLSDLHVQHPQFMKREFEDEIKKISSNINSDDFITFGGDIFDSIYPNDKRYDVRSVDEELQTLDDSIDWMRSMLDSLYDIDILFLEGNHENKLAKMGQNPLKHLVSGNKHWTSGPYGAIISLGNSWGYMNHGRGSGRTSGSKLNVLESMISVFNNINFAFMGHVHWLYYNRLVLPQYNMKTKKLEKHHIWGGITGCFLQTWTNKETDVSIYSERAIYKDVEAGYLLSHIQNGKINNVEYQYVEER